MRNSKKTKALTQRSTFWPKSSADASQDILLILYYRLQGYSDSGLLFQYRRFEMGNGMETGNWRHET
jgi:hypothetical protein